MEYHEKEVRFDLYCPTCVHKDEPETHDACDDCLAHPSNTDSRKPIRYQDKYIGRRQT